MSTKIDFFEDECPWYYFDTSYKTLLGVCIAVLGLTGVLLNGWLFLTFLHSHLLSFKSHLLVLNLSTASFARNFLEFPFFSSSALGKRWLFGTESCHLFAFYTQFLGVFQIIALFALAFERYYQIRLYKNEKKLCIVFHWMMVGVCWFWAALLSIPPLFKYGTYTCDATGTVCSYLWPALSSGAKEMGFAVLLVLFGGIIPVASLLYFVTLTIPMERRYYKSEIQREQRSLTKSIYVAIALTMLLWAPSAILAVWQWVPLLLYGYRLHVPPALVLLAPVASEAATSIPVLCYLVYDERLRAALLGRMGDNYALLSPKRAKKYVITPYNKNYVSMCRQNNSTNFDKKSLDE